MERSKMRILFGLFLAVIITCLFIHVAFAGESTLVKSDCSIVKNGKVYSGFVPDVNYHTYTPSPMADISPREQSHVKVFRYKKQVIETRG